MPWEVYAVVEGNTSEAGRMQHPNFFPGWGGHLLRTCTKRFRLFAELFCLSRAVPSAVRWKMLIVRHVSPAGLPVLVVASIVACCCWRMKM